VVQVLVPIFEKVTVPVPVPAPYQKKFEIFFNFLLSKLF
jgi:hypothetical protein